MDSEIELEVLCFPLKRHVVLELICLPLEIFKDIRGSFEDRFEHTWLLKQQDGLCCVNVRLLSSHLLPNEFHYVTSSPENKIYGDVNVGMFGRPAMF